MNFAASLLVALTLTVAGARAQDLEPRSYSNTPVGLNFLIAGYGHAYGDISFDPSLPIVDAQYRQNSGVFAYARSLDAWGKSAKFDVVLPYSSFSGHALVSGQTRERAMSGWNDPRFRVSVNFFGAPALSLKEFAAYRQDVIVGASLQVTAPLGRYDNDKLVNLGNNRWSFKPELGVSKAWGPWTVEVAPSATFYTDNTDFNKGNRFAQAPLYAVQGHVIYGFPSGKWLAFNGTYFTGNRTTVNGVQSNNMQTNTRAGVTFAMPVDRSNSIKLHVGTGATTRTGTEYTAVAITWQHRWGGGF
jgi:Putative MetA-pathway of phenol degradation